MDIIKTSTNQSLLREKGILLESGEICQDKINLISGSITAPLIETIWAFTDHDTGAMERILVIFSHLYHEGHEAEMMAVLRILHDITGLQFSKDVELLADNAKARQYFLFSFLLDMEDCMQDFMAKFAVE